MDEETWPVGSDRLTKSHRCKDTVANELGSIRRPRFPIAESKERREVGARGVLWGCHVCACWGGKPYRSQLLEKHKEYLNEKMRDNEVEKGREFVKGIEKWRGSCFRSLWGRGADRKPLIHSEKRTHVYGKEGKDAKGILCVSPTVQLGVTRTSSDLQRLSSLCR